MGPSSMGVMRRGSKAGRLRRARLYVCSPTCSGIQLCVGWKPTEWPRLEPSRAPHRIGRTGRAGAVGESMTFLTPQRDAGQPAGALVGVLLEAGQHVPPELEKLAEAVGRGAGGGSGGRGRGGGRGGHQQQSRGGGGGRGREEERWGRGDGERGERGEGGRGREGGSHRHHADDWRGRHHGGHGGYGDRGGHGGHGGHGGEGASWGGRGRREAYGRSSE